MADGRTSTLAPFTTAARLTPIDGRTRLARVVRHVRREVTLALGGPDAISPQQRLLIQQVAESEALRRAVFAIAASGEPISIADYTNLAATTQRALRTLGIRRVPKDALPTLHEYLAAASRQPEAVAVPRSDAAGSDAMPAGDGGTGEP